MSCDVCGQSHEIYKAGLISRLEPIMLWNVKGKGICENCVRAEEVKNDA